MSHFYVSELSRLYFAATTSMMLYARGVVHSAFGNVAEAEIACEEFIIAKQNVPDMINAR